MLQTIERNPERAEAEERRRAEAAAAIERRLGLGAATATKPQAKSSTAAKTETSTSSQPTWVKMNGGRFGRRFIPAPERIFSRKEIRWAVLAAGAYLVAAAAMGLFSALEHRPAITPTKPVLPNSPGTIEATEMPQLPADNPSGG